MPKSRKVPRSRRKRGMRPPIVPSAPPATPRPVAPPVEMSAAAGAPAAQAQPARFRGTARRVAEDYSYVRRDLQRVAVLATAVIVAIIVLSFFLP